MRNRYNFVKGLLLILLTGVGVVSHAQAPWNYNSPLDRRIYSIPYTSTQQVTINPAEWGSAASSYGADGLTIVANFVYPYERDLERIRLLQLKDAQGNIYMEMYSENKTILIKRYDKSLGGKSYEYELLDQMFVNKAGAWEVRFYITGFFMWLQSRDPVTEQTYLSPLYFGLDFVHSKNMNDLINGKGSIVVGDNRARQTFFIREALSVYAFKYVNLRDDIGNKFSWPGPGEITQDYWDDVYEEVYR